VFILWWIIVGVIAGFITGKIMKSSGYGVLVGIIGGIVAVSSCGHSDTPAAKTYLHHLRRGRRRGHPDVPVASHQRQSTLSLQSGP
jgi:hypothetical protein